MRRRWILALVGLVLLFAIGAAAAAYVVWKRHHPGTIHGSASTEFETTAEPGATTRPEEVVREVPWPTYGYDEQRTRYAPPFDHRPPYRQVWERNLSTLAEFPPVLAYGRAYIGVINSRFRAIDTNKDGVISANDSITALPRCGTSRRRRVSRCATFAAPNTIQPDTGAAITDHEHAEYGSNSRRELA